MAIEIAVSGKKSHGRTVQSPIYGYYHFTNVRIGAGVITGSFISDGITVTNPYAVYNLAETDLTLKINESSGENELKGDVFIHFYADKDSYDNGVEEIPLSFTLAGKPVAIKNRINVTFIEQSENFSGDILDELCGNFMDHVKDTLAAEYSFITVNNIASGDYNAKGTSIATRIGFFQNQECKKNNEELTIHDWEVAETSVVKIPTQGIPTAIDQISIATQGMLYFMLLAKAVFEIKIPEAAGKVSVVDVS